MASTVNWRTEQVTAIFVKASMDTLSELAFIGEGRTKINITDNDQVDTGFMRASTYAVTPGKSDYAGNIAEAGLRAYEGDARRDAAPAVALPNDHTVAIAVAAEYAIYQEMLNPFLFPAIESLAKDFNGVVVRHKVEK
jgi:hypothetical protein